MDVWRIFTGIIGLLLLLFVFYDSLKTTLAVSRDGPLTQKITLYIRVCSLGILKKFASVSFFKDHIVTSIGTVTLMTVVFSWYFLLWVAWALLFTWDPSGIVNTLSSEPTLEDTVGAYIYFAGFSLTTLGVGDLSPRTSLYRILACISALNGFFFVSLTATYTFNVVQAFSQSREVSIKIWSLGSRPRKILLNCWNGENFGVLENQISQINQDIASQGQLQHNFPTMFNYYSTRRRSTLFVQIANYLELIYLLEYAVTDSKIDRLLFLQAKRALEEYYNSILTGHVIRRVQQPPPVIDLGQLKEICERYSKDRELSTISFVDPEEFNEVMRKKEIVEMRRNAATLVESTGLWSWGDLHGIPEPSTQEG